MNLLKITIKNRKIDGTEKAESEKANQQRLSFL